MKIKEILSLLSVLIIVSCISPILNIIVNFINIIDNYDGYLLLIALFSSMMLSILTLRNIRLEKSYIFQFYSSIIIFGLNLGILIYLTIIIRDFWINLLVGLTLFKFTSLVSIFCSLPLALFSYSHIKSTNEMKFSLEELKSKIKLFYLRLGTLVAYIPVIAGIFYSMTAMPALAYISWNIFRFWPGIGFMASWIFHDDYTTTFPVIPLLWIELVTFVFGSGLFLFGLIHLVKAKKEKTDIVQTGPYKYIRHPQNLGIIIFSLPFCLYVPFLGDTGLKVGDIFSWMLFCLLIIIYSDIEELHIVRRYPEEYKLYRENTGFLIPKIVTTKKERSKMDLNDYLFRWFLFVGVYILLISILTLVFSYFPLIYLRYYY